MFWVRPKTKEIRNSAPEISYFLVFGAYPRSSLQPSTYCLRANSRRFAAGILNPSKYHIFTSTACLRANSETLADLQSFKSRSPEHFWSWGQHLRNWIRNWVSGAGDPEFLISFCLLFSDFSVGPRKFRGWFLNSMFSYSVLAL